MSKRSALIVWGGWPGHEPKEVGEFFEGQLKAEGFEVEVSDTLDAFLDTEKLNGLSVIVPIWTMGEITNDQCKAVMTAVSEHGVGLAGCHGGMCDAFRQNTEWQFMTGGQWVAHPGNDGVDHRIKIDPFNPHPITEGIKDFDVKSEQYFLHTDPCNDVLAYTEFPNPNVPGNHDKNKGLMPQVWTKMWGKGRVYYNALGHHRDVFDGEEAAELMRRGFLWSAKGVGL